MAKPKIFVSSTCYDLAAVRTELRAFLESLGYEPIMSEYSEVLYDPRRHTHDSCVKEIASADILVLIIGSRLGGEALPSAKALIDFDALAEDWSTSKLSEFKDKLSITQLEVLKAIESGIPVYSFVEQGVYRDHLFYEKNKKKQEIISSIDFPSISKAESAVYIFEFINFLRKRGRNNSISEFSSVEDIRSTLRSQWAHLFQRLLNESLNSERTSREYSIFSNQIEDLKAALLTSIGSDQLKKTASSVLRFRMLLDFLLGLMLDDRRGVVLGDLTWDDVLEKADVSEVLFQVQNRMGRPEILLIRSDRTFYHFRGSENLYSRLQSDWSDFRVMNEPAKEAVYDALLDTRDGRSMMLLRYRDEPVERYLESLSSTKDDLDDDVPF